MIFAQPKFSQFCLSIYCLVGLFVGMPATVCAHVYEDGFVERSLTITIRDGVGYGEYQIGLNAKTADQILELAQQLKRKKNQSEMPNSKPAVAGHHDQLKKTQPIAPTEARDANEATKSNKIAESKAGAESESKNGAAPKPATVPEQLGTVGAGEHLTELATIKRFGELQDQWFTDRLKLSCDGQAVEFSKLSVEPAARHPYSILVKFQFPLHKNETNQALPVVEERGAEPKTNPPAAQVAPANQVEPAARAVDFQVTDHLFAGYSGAVRYALRARGSTMLLRSNVAPVLVRAERLEIDQNAAIEQKGAPTIQAKLTVGGQ